VIQTVTGRAVSPTALQRLLLFRAEAGDYIWEYQAQQISPEEVVLRVVPTPRFDREAAVRMQVALSGLLGPGMTARVEAVDQLPRERSGKRRVILPLADVGG
jgi:acyl-coenzyme A synthetase/AMP-(fatty) acid ligase